MHVAALTNYNGKLLSHFDTTSVLDNYPKASGFEEETRDPKATQRKIPKVYERHSLAREASEKVKKA